MQLRVIFSIGLLPQARVHGLRVSLHGPWHAGGVFRMVRRTYPVIPKRNRLSAAFSAVTTSRKKNRII